MISQIFTSYMLGTRNGDRSSEQWGKALSSWDKQNTNYCDEYFEAKVKDSNTKVLAI